MLKNLHALNGTIKNNRKTTQLQKFQKCIYIKIFKTYNEKVTTLISCFPWICLRPCFNKVVMFVCRRTSCSVSSSCWRRTRRTLRTGSRTSRRRTRSSLATATSASRTGVMLSSEFPVVLGRQWLLALIRAALPFYSTEAAEIGFRHRCLLKLWSFLVQEIKWFDLSSNSL